MANEFAERHLARISTVFWSERRASASGSPFADVRLKRIDSRFGRHSCEY